MRVLQLIDSLEAGGAERMAIHYANALVPHVEESHLCVTRKEGILKESISPSVGYIYAAKKSTLDKNALKTVKKYIKEHNITIIHAHTTSYFFAVLLKLQSPNIKIIWHEHQGNRVHQSKKNNKVLYMASYFFSAIFTVNEALSEWCKNNLLTKPVHYIPNFVVAEGERSPLETREKEIVCVANLKAPKNHLNLLQAFREIHKQFPDWKLLLVGRTKEDAYNAAVRRYISENKMESVVSLLGEQSNVFQILNAASIGVLSSDDEGLPVALLEYGFSGLAVVTTDVGHCKEVVQDYGRIVPSNDSVALSKALQGYIQNKQWRVKDAQLFSEHIEHQYASASVIPKIIHFYKEVIQ